VFDEAHRAARLQLIPTMAKECRKYGISLVLASQEAKDFNVSLFSAVANYLVLRLNEPDAKALVRNVASSDRERMLVDKIKGMDRFKGEQHHSSQHPGPDAYAGKVHEVIIADGNISRSLDVGGEIHGLDLSDDDGTLFVSGKGDDKIAAIDLSSGKAKFAALAPAPYHLTTIAGTNSLFVSSREEPKVWIVDQENLAVTGEIAVSGEGHEMVVLP